MIFIFIYFYLFLFRFDTFTCWFLFHRTGGTFQGIEDTGRFLLLLWIRVDANTMLQRDIQFESKNGPRVVPNVIQSATPYPYDLRFGFCKTLQV